MFLPALSQEVPGLKRWPWGLICRSVIDNSSGELTKIMNFGNLSSRLFIKLRVINYMYLISVYCQVSFFFFFFAYGSSSYSISYSFYLSSYKECPPDRASLGVSLIVE